MQPFSVSLALLGKPVLTVEGVEGLCFKRIEGNEFFGGPGGI